MLRVRVFPCAFSIALLFFLTLTNIHLSLSVCMRAPFKYCGPLRSRYLPRRSMCAAETTAKQGRVSCTPRSTAVRCVVGGFPRRLVPRKGSVLSPLRLMECFFFFFKKRSYGGGCCFHACFILRRCDQAHRTTPASCVYVCVCVWRRCGLVSRKQFWMRLPTTRRLFCFRCDLLSRPHMNESFVLHLRFHASLFCLS
jgi:hypothetical protein